MSVSPTEVWITGIGLVSSLGEGLDAHWQALTTDNPKPVVDTKSFAPYPIHPLCEIDFSKQIPKRGDLRQMEDWQRIGTYAAGMALDDASIKGDDELLAKMHIIAAAGNGERDPEADAIVLEAIKGDPDWREKLNDLLLTNLRPTLYLAQQTQLLAGNISIVHKVTGGSRTFKGEELAGVQIVENAVQRIRAGQGELFLVGAAYNAARWDQLLALGLNQFLHEGKWKSIWDLDDGAITGSMGAFLVIESKAHALARGAKPYAKISNIQTGVDVDCLPEGVEGDRSGSPVLCGFGGEHHPMAGWADSNVVLRSPTSMLGHGAEASFPANIALAALSLSRGAFYSPCGNLRIEKPLSQKTSENLSTILVSAYSIDVGDGYEGAALVEKVDVND